MRKIKFKVNCKKHNREEIYTLGDLIMGRATTENGEGGIFENWRQYTGLHDKNGKEIYEGDILKVIHKGEEYIGKVIYEYNGFILDVINMNRNYGRVCLDMLERYIEVIGNIYENPELLEE